MPTGSLAVSIQAALFRLNHSRLWHRSVRLGERRYRAPTADRLLALWLHRVGLLGRQEMELFARLVRPGMRVADIGANQGLFTVLLSRLVGDTGTVLAGARAGEAPGGRDGPGGGVPDAHQHPGPPAGEDPVDRLAARAIMRRVEACVRERRAPGPYPRLL